MCASPLDTRRPFDIFEIQIGLSDGAACTFEDAYLTNFSKFRNLVSHEGIVCEENFHGFSRKWKLKRIVRSFNNGCRECIVERI